MYSLVHTSMQHVRIFTAWSHEGCMCGWVDVRWVRKNYSFFSNMESSPAFQGTLVIEEGECLVCFMVNSVSISWLLPSLQRTAQAYRSLQKSSGFDSHTVQSFILRPRAMNQCQQTFHWNHMNPHSRTLYSLSHSCSLFFPTSIFCSFFMLPAPFLYFLFSM